MLKKTIKYTDYNETERTEDFYFNLTKAELNELQLTTPGGYAGYLQKMAAEQDTPKLIGVIKDLILKAYGEKSLDGRMFVKIDASGNPVSRMFMQTEAFSNLYIELASDTDAAIKFVIGIMPKELQEKAAELNLTDPLHSEIMQEANRIEVLSGANV